MVRGFIRWALVRCLSERVRNPARRLQAHRAPNPRNERALSPPADVRNARSLTGARKSRTDLQPHRASKEAPSFGRVRPRAAHHCFNIYPFFTPAEKMRSISFQLAPPSKRGFSPVKRASSSGSTGGRTFAHHFGRLQLYH